MAVVSCWRAKYPAPCHNVKTCTKFAEKGCKWFSTSVVLYLLMVRMCLRWYLVSRAIWLIWKGVLNRIINSHVRRLLGILDVFLILKRTWSFHGTTGSPDRLGNRVLLGNGNLTSEMLDMLLDGYFGACDLVAVPNSISEGAGFVG